MQDKIARLRQHLKVRERHPECAGIRNADIRATIESMEKRAAVASDL